MAQGKWIIASNRLPFNKDPKTGALIRSSGGLISAITGIQSDHPKVWVGAVPPDLTPEEWERKEAQTREDTTRYAPLFLPADKYDAYYNRVANDVIWPLFHYESNRVKFSWRDWEVYREVNRQFAEVIVREAASEDLVWVHDFHLLLVPQYIKELNPRLRVGYFLHIPFPSSEIFRGLPPREEVLRSLLASDLVGFHDYGYLRHFSSALHTVLGIESNLVRLSLDGREVRLGVFPVSIDTQRFQRESRKPEIRKTMKRIRKPAEFLILGVDRLDYIKGIELKLLAFRDMLKNHPEFCERVSLVQLAVPSRTGVPEYVRLKNRIDMLVGEINGEFGTVDWVPIHYLFSSVPFDELLALYRMADILLVTSKRDGMNLVCLEYLASQDPKAPGEILLSEFAGAISTLSHVVPINPWDTRNTGEAIARALRTAPEERAEKYQVMIRYLENYTATDWARSFMDALAPKQDRRTRQPRVDIRVAGEKTVIPAPLRNRLRKSPVVLLLDYDGTLTPIVNRPEEALLSGATRSVLKELIGRSRYDLVVVSGRDTGFLQEQFRDLPISLAGEHGGKFRRNGGGWQSLVHTDKRVWFGIAYQIMRDYASRVPGSFIEKKEYAISWHYRQAPAEFAAYQARKLEEDLELALINLPVNVINGKKVIEARAVEANKGTFARWYLDTHGSADGFCLAIGDDRTDEDMFACLGDRGAAIKIGEEPTHAQYRIGRQEDLIPFLKELSRLGE